MFPLSRVMYLIYSVLYLIVTAILLPFEYAKRPAVIRRRWLKEKFGLIDSAPSPLTSPLVWVHAVSVGEVIAAVPFMKEVRKRHPELGIILSTVTDTGQRIARERVSGIAHIVYLPFDLVPVFRRVIRRFRPAAFITIETELWPNIFRTCRKEGVPVLVMNGRLSENSFKGYRRIRFFMKDVVNHVEMFCMQEDAYAERVRALGAADSRVTVTGNFKFDTAPPDRRPLWPRVLKGPVILAGSTHKGEEELIVSVFEELRKDLSGINLVLAPRHPERFGEVEEMMKAKGVGYIKRSEIAEPGVRGTEYSEETSSATDHRSSIVLLDTVGELASAYSVCDIAVIGGSFISHGGHNPLEPAFWEKPVVCGPHMENFPFVEEFYQKGGAIKTDSGSLYAELKRLMLSPEERHKAGKTARALYEERAGSIGRAMKVLERYLDL